MAKATSPRKRPGHPDADKDLHPKPKTDDPIVQADGEGDDPPPPPPQDPPPGGVNPPKPPIIP